MEIALDTVPPPASGPRRPLTRAGMMVGIGRPRAMTHGGLEREQPSNGVTATESHWPQGSPGAQDPFLSQDPWAPTAATTSSTTPNTTTSTPPGTSSVPTGLDQPSWSGPTPPTTSSPQVAANPEFLGIADSPMERGLRAGTHRAGSQADGTGHP